MSMPLIDYYIAEGEATVGLRWHYPDGSPGDLEQEWPTVDMLWDADRRIFAWRWIGEDSSGHAMRVKKVTEDDYAVLLDCDYITVEIGPIWNDDQRAKIARWVKNSDRAEIKHYLQIAVDAQAESEPLITPPPVLHEYQAMLEWHRVAGSLDRWVLVAAWAANEDEVALVAQKRYKPLEDTYGDMRKVTDPLGALDYWWRQADEVLTRRGRIDAVQAASARDAATIALAHGWPKDYLDREYINNG